MSSRLNGEAHSTIESHSGRSDVKQEHVGANAMDNFAGDSRLTASVGAHHAARIQAMSSTVLGLGKPSKDFKGMRCSGLG
jgi:hypothetical protein